MAYLRSNIIDDRRVQNGAVKALAEEVAVRLGYDKTVTILTKTTRGKYRVVTGVVNHLKQLLPGKKFATHKILNGVEIVLMGDR